jgi:hypothetical protein
MREGAGAALGAASGGTSFLGQLALRYLGPPAASILLLLLGMGAVAVVGVAAAGPGQASTGAVQCQQIAGPAGTPPGYLLPIYVSAASASSLGTTGWAYLAAINRVETDFGQNLSVSSAGAIGWMQFEPGTWAIYGEGGDPYNPSDAIPATARMLTANGAPQSWSQAVSAYNPGDPAYVRQVLGYAAVYLQDCVTTQIASVSTSGLANPLAQAPHVVAERIDQGVDYADNSPECIDALAQGTVTMAGRDPGWYGNAVNYTITASGYGGPQYVYVAEGITPEVAAGETVSAGQCIAQFIPGSSTGIETGFAASAGQFEAEAMALGEAAHSGDPGQHRTACGQLMSDLIASAGGPAGLPEGRPVIGIGGTQLPAGQDATVSDCPALGGAASTAAGPA